MYKILLSFIFLPIFLGLTISTFQLKKKKLIYKFYTSFVSLISLFLFTKFHFFNQDIYLSQVFGNWVKAIGIEFVFSYESSVALLYVSIISFFNAISIDSKIAKDSTISFFLILQSALCGIILTNDLFNLYIFIELSCFACYGIYSIFKTPKALKSLFDYIMINISAGLFILFAIFIIYKETNNLNLTIIKNILTDGIYSHNKSIILSYIFFIFSFIMKIGFIPFHKNIQNIYMNTDSSVANYTSNIVSKIYIIALIKITLCVFGYNLFINFPNVAIFFLFLLIVSILFFVFISSLENRIYVFVYTQIIYQSLIYFSFLPFLGNEIFTKYINFSILFNGIAFFVNFSIIKNIQDQTKEEIFNIKTFGTFLQKARFYKYLFLFNLLSLSGLPFSYLFIQKLVILIEFNLYHNYVELIIFILFNFSIFFVNMKMLNNILKPINLELIKEKIDLKIKQNKRIIFIGVFSILFHILSIFLVFIK